MPFVYQERTDSAVDTERGITIRESTKYLDIADAFPFYYQDQFGEFMFLVTQGKREKPGFTPAEKQSGDHLEQGTFILEDTFRRSFLDATGTIYPRNYEETKAAAREGLFVLETRGGILQRLPKYKVDFIPGMSNFFPNR